MNHPVSEKKYKFESSINTTFFIFIFLIYIIHLPILHFRNLKDVIKFQSESKVREEVDVLTSFVKVTEIDLSFTTSSSSAIDGTEVRATPVAFIADLTILIAQYLDMINR